MMPGKRPLVQYSGSRGIGVGKTMNLWDKPDFTQVSEQNISERSSSHK